MLLPRAELLEIAESPGGGRTVPFDVALEHLGTHLKRVDRAVPERWLVESFPTAAEIAALPEVPPLSRVLEWFEDREYKR